MPIPSVPELVHAWVDGWTVSRGTDGPVTTPWGLRVEVGEPGHQARHVLPEADEALLRALSAAETAPEVWIKTFVEPERVAAGLGSGWNGSHNGELMATRLRRSAVAVPDGYRVESEYVDAVTQLRVLAEDGSVAAKGRVAVTGGSAVVDRISTDPEHRRRGLGSVVMRTLANTAVDAGAELGVLGASFEGRALYLTLGWEVRAPLNSYVREPQPAA
ncbi:GNAT family N-acetyltransferase [Streptacidiphilus albus]|uniref:GNAT family N-acetyltransferase n=1 Tax=Streptacidiphilus albus TaxID=105425 RepID=UPI00054AFCFE|nr:GNAT family N-acetyltransferase [Streptacidiphilus albus]